MSVHAKKVDKCIKKRERYFSNLQLCFDLIRELPNKKSVFMARCKDLSNLYSKFEEVSEELDDLNLSVEDETNVVATGEPCKQFDIMFYEIKAVYESLLNEEVKAPSSSMDTPPVVQPKLPQIDISKFGGQLEQFNSFKSLYDNLIHTSSMAPIEKFSYLKSLLEGVALSLVEAIPFDPDHYLLAYNTLVERYTNPRILASFYLNRILDQPPIKTANLASLRQLLDTFHINVEALKSLKIDDLSGFTFLQLALRLLDPNTRKAFEQEYKSVSFPDFKNLMSFLQSQCAIIELTKNASKVEPTKSFASSPRKAFMTTQPSPPKSDKPAFSSKLQKPVFSCPQCKGEHNLYHCPKFLEMVPSVRYATVRSLKRCFSCFGSHMISNCASASSCRYCKSKRHHSLLHDSDKGLTEVHTSNDSPHTSGKPNPSATEHDGSISKQLTPAETPLQSLSCNLNRNQNNPTAILSTAKVLVRDYLGNWQNCRVVVDGGSQINFVTNSFAHCLGLPSRKCSIDITGIGQTNHLSAKGVVSCEIASRYNENDKLQINAVVIPKISSDLPAIPLSESLRKKFSSLNLADPDFHRPAKIDMLIGAQAFTDILTDGLSLIKGHPSALYTIFGWILMGEVQVENPSKQANSLFVSTLTLDEVLHKFWETEEIPSLRPLDPEEQACEEHFKTTICRDETGRYVASLPFRDGKPPDLGSNRDIALKKFFQLEKRFHRQSEFKEFYVNNLQDYMSQKHIVKASEPSSYILTHHGVLKDSSTSPLRVVFNASETSDNDNSLNKSLLVGPKLQPDIGRIITNFRIHPIALTCDIKQMYRAIRLARDDCKYHHIFWRSDSSHPVEEYELQRLTFGVSSSPFIAQRTLKQLVEDEGHRYPLAAEALSSSCYIDDIVTGASSEEQAIFLFHDLTNLLKEGGFELHKWSSSSESVLRAIPTEHRESRHLLGSGQTLKVLGLEWDPSSDNFKYSITPLDKTPTKRNVLSQVARMYDVNGYISPVIFSLKHLLQQIWMEKLDWDDPLPTELCIKWNKIVSEIPLLANLKIPRFALNSYFSIQLIGFSDASKIGMCAVLYLRLENENGQIFSYLLQSKTKVAPLKPLTIPRLELCAALLLSRLVQSNSQFISNLRINDILLFSDSMNVLGWIHSPPHLLETFVSNRVCKILESTSIRLWHHIPGDQNPADCGSRGVFPSQMINHPVWWHGPTFMFQTKSSWPITPYDGTTDLPEVNFEQKTTLASHKLQNDLYDKISQYSSFNKLINVMAYVLRFIHNLRHSKTEKCYGPLSVEERRNSTKSVIRIVQHHHYYQDIQCLKQNKPCTNKLKNLSPFLYQDILMVGGRLQFAPLPQSSRHPYLIPSNCHLAILLCDHYHIYSLHGGPKVVQSLLLRSYWIPGARSLIRKRIFNCLRCYKLRAKPGQPFMADLPLSRFQTGRCFSNVGLDFAGPYLVKESTRRNARLSKCYVALFICMSVKAIHLELVGALTTESCLAAIDRFISRRGLPQNIYSDQGTNFIGAARQLKEVYDLLKTSHSQITDHLAKREIKWNFNPPHAANFGGLWEAGVKSMKHHLKRILENNHFTSEEFTTFLCRTEAVLNSRPLCPLSNLPEDDLDYLSPGHFLTGGPLLSRPEKDVSEEPSNYLSRWKMVTQASQLFWKRWAKEYLHTLVQRPKWSTCSNNLVVGDLVLMYNVNMSPLCWPLGRVTKVFPGHDGIVRVVQVQTATGSFTRPVNKLVSLVKYINPK